MADHMHVALLREGVQGWNHWRHEHPSVRPDLSFAALDDWHLEGVNLSRADLTGASLSGTFLSGAYLIGANMRRANLTGAFLGGADLRRADIRSADLSDARLGGALLANVNLEAAKLHETHLLRANLMRARLHSAGLIRANLAHANLLAAHLQRADLRQADLRGAHLHKADFDWADLREANLSHAVLTGTNLDHARLERANFTAAVLQRASLASSNLSHSVLVQTDLRNAKIIACKVYGISAWDLRLDNSLQQELEITPPGTSTITVDNLEVAQFIYLMLQNEKIRDIIDTVTSKVVLILGRFTPERKAVLDAVRGALRMHPNHYVPVLFDFQGPSSHNFKETVTLLARMARFVVADLTDPGSVPLELEAIVPHIPVPVQCLLLAGSSTFSMADALWMYPWMLPTYQYSTISELVTKLHENVIAPSEAKVRELQVLRTHPSSGLS